MKPQPKYDDMSEPGIRTRCRKKSFKTDADDEDSSSVENDDDVSWQVDCCETHFGKWIGLLLMLNLILMAIARTQQQRHHYVVQPTREWRPEAMDRSSIDEESHDYHDGNNVKEDYSPHMLNNPIPSVARHKRRLLQQQTQQADTNPLNTNAPLQGLRVLVALAAYDFSQIPHLEEVLDGYHDVCIAGAASVVVAIHTTVPYPVALMDLLKTRFPCPAFHMEVILQSPMIKLHLVDCHRSLFYQRIQDFDLFIYSEDDIRVTPHIVVTYLQQTHRIEQLLKEQPENAAKKWVPADFNVGIVRYEYNFPNNVVIDDTTRHATENVTRVYWEHSSFDPPIIPKALDRVPQEPLSPYYLHMKNHHQGMFLATRDLLLEWQKRPKCRFDLVTNRPGRGKNGFQPTRGTQRVWMSSLQLYGPKNGCGVQQVLPMNKFGALTVHHIPNKNYRRVGQYRTRDTNRDESVEVSTAQLVTAMQLHIAVTRAFPMAPGGRPYDNKITMVDHAEDDCNNNPKDPQLGISKPEKLASSARTLAWKKRLAEYEAYVARGGIMSEQDMLQTSLALEEE